MSLNEIIYDSLAMRKKKIKCLLYLSLAKANTSQKMFWNSIILEYSLQKDKQESR